jgi:hypothetical protein
MMEAACTYETSVDNYFARQYIPEDNSELQSNNCNRSYTQWKCYYILLKFWMFQEPQFRVLLLSKQDVTFSVLPLPRLSISTSKRTSTSPFRKESCVVLHKGGKNPQCPLKLVVCLCPRGIILRQRSQERSQTTLTHNGVYMNNSHLPRNSRALT